MLEDVALEYNSRRERGWLERDYDSLRRKFRNLYKKPTLSVIYSEISPKRRHIALAHDIQYAIEVKSGAHTSQDGFDRAQDDSHLLRDVDAVLAANDRNVTNDGDTGAEKGAADNKDLPESKNSANEDGGADKEDLQVFHVIFSQLAQTEPEESQDVTPRATGTVITRHGTFDSSLANDVWSEDDEDGGSRGSQTDVHRAEGEASPPPPSAPLLVQYRLPTYKADALIGAVLAAFEILPSRTLDKTIVTLQKVMECIMITTTLYHMKVS
ncbi:hypothetical protein PR001_g4147 [Phytophthora rubi]|uniref:DUF6818 domain-containing protein n=1 Tax=Phytophthora rubi TaxID=129364 RepID=A0A6A3NL40_9STRA|nr:hypothetical protein PR002_g4300 [Phytophthora rubi]KAE9047586.1 hypothetical protein PR001_g4147 [Phytophthora rubi]